MLNKSEDNPPHIAVIGLSSKIRPCLPCPWEQPACLTSYPSKAYLSDLTSKQVKTRHHYGLYPGICASVNEEPQLSELVT